MSQIIIPNRIPAPNTHPMVIPTMAPEDRCVVDETGHVVVALTIHRPEWHIPEPHALDNVHDIPSGCTCEVVIPELQVRNVQSSSELLGTKVYPESRLSSHTSRPQGSLGAASCV